MARFLGLFLSLALVGCTAPADRFDAFERRVVDGGTTSGCVAARTTRRTTAAPPDVTGDHLLAITASFAMATPLQFRCATTFTADGDGGVLGLSCLPLLVDDDDTAEDERAPTGDALVATGVPVGADGSFCANIGGVVPGVANPISGSDVVTTDAGLDLAGTLTSADGFCGTFTGGIVQPFESDIMGTFAAVRVPTGAEGSDLPAPVKACP
jgi:hypothetical protein